jgi:hypothetical protein
VEPVTSLESVVELAVAVLLLLVTLELHKEQLVEL